MTLISKSTDIKDKVDYGMSPIDAGREYLEEQTVITTKELTDRLYLYIAMTITAVIGIIATCLLLFQKNKLAAAVAGFTLNLSNILTWVFQRISKAPQPLARP